MKKKEFIETFLAAPREVQNLVMTILEAPEEEKTEIAERIMKSHNVELSSIKEGMC